MNWNNWTYSQKNKYIGIGYLVFMVLVYQLALRNSIDLYQQNNALEDKLKVARTSTQSEDELEKSKDKLEGQIAAYFVDSLSHQEQLLEMLSTFSSRNGILIKEIPFVTVYTEGDFQIRTHKVVMEGNFIPLLKLVYALEQKNKLGRVSSIDFSLKYDHKRKKEVLSLILYLQNIQLSKNEKI